MKKELLFVLSVLLVGIALADERDHHAGPPENHPDFKVFRWGENIAGDCHQVGATLVIRSNGSASFDSNIWTHTHGTDVWHSTVHLRGPGGEPEIVVTMTVWVFPTITMGPGIRSIFITISVFPQVTSAALTKL